MRLRKSDSLGPATPNEFILQNNNPYIFVFYSRQG